MELSEWNFEATCTDFCGGTGAERTRPARTGASRSIGKKQ
jgi:hypothetical protein